MVFWGMALCSLMDRYYTNVSEECIALIFRKDEPEDGGSRFFQDIAACLLNCTLHHIPEDCNFDTCIEHQISHFCISLTNKFVY
jgi:hypothetical protein